jgi:hypothetical protein
MNGIKEPRKQIRINRIKQTPFDGRVLDEVFATHLKQKKKRKNLASIGSHRYIYTSGIDPPPG